MIQISGATERLEAVTTDATATLDVQVDYAVWDLTTGLPTITSPKNQCTTLTGAATTTILTAIGANLSGRVKAIFVTNTHATLAQTFNAQRILSGPTTFKFKKITLQPNEMAVMNETGVWFVYDGICAVKGTAQGPVDVQVFTTPGSNTWTKPTSFTPKCTIVKVWGAGGGGGGGASLATAVVAKGGAGGGGGAFLRESYVSTDLASTVTVTVGTGGTAGASGSAGAVPRPRNGRSCRPVA